ncbi:MAG TPA: hypothetical protein VFY87_05530 [Geminicoccaceae bacterium]|nr:hypothetical protein [Geminicoccaceae bacterium]
MSMAWSPPARQRRSWLAAQAGDYATPISHHIRDGTRQAPPYVSGAFDDLLKKLKSVFAK